MATKLPKLCFESFRNKCEAVEIWLDQFNDFSILQDWRGPTKASSDPDHYIVEKRALEISTFRLGLPSTVLSVVKTMISPLLTDDASAPDAQDRFCGFGKNIFSSITLGKIPFWQSEWLFWSANRKIQNRLLTLKHGVNTTVFGASIEP